MTGTVNTRTLDLATFTPPFGWHVEERGSGSDRCVVISKAASGSYCMAVVYASASAGGDLETSFASEWARTALQSLAPVATPRAVIRDVGALRLAIGAAPSTAQGQPIVGLLIVADAGARVVSILVLSPTFESLDTFRAEVDTVFGSLVVQRVEGGAPGARPVAEPARRTLAVGDLAGEWGRQDGINTRYVDAHSGAYAGTDSIHFTEKWQITASGTISLDFFGIHNGRRITETATATVTLAPDGILVVHKPNEQRFVLRGWEETPEMTVMTLNGPWYESIPADVVANPGIGVNLDQRWVRLRR